jgi:hypothetical protein
VKAKHNCGESRNSDTCYHVHVTPPDQVTEFTYQIDGCSVRFDWSAPVFNGNADIHSYDLIVQNVNGDYMQLNECGEDPVDVKCIVSLETLEASPFFLTGDKEIVAKIRARNPNGPGDFSEVTNNTAIQMVTTQVDAPILSIRE